MGGRTSQRRARARARRTRERSRSRGGIEGQRERDDASADDASADLTTTPARRDATDEVPRFAIPIAPRTTRALLARAFEDTGARRRADTEVKATAAIVALRGVMTARVRSARVRECLAVTQLSHLSSLGRCGDLLG